MPGVSLQYLREASPRIFIRVLPPVVWVAVFLSAARNRRESSIIGSLVGSSDANSWPVIALPTSDELLALVSAWGFRRKDWTSNPTTLFTHLLVHASLPHLISNTLAYAAVSLEFGADDNNGLEERLIGRTMRASVIKTLTSTSVLIVGGVVGGLAGHLLQAKRLEVRAKDSYGFGFGFLECVVGSVHKKVAERVFVCGASAGIAALGGFNAVFYGRYLSGMFTLMPALLAVVASEEDPQQPLFFLNWSGEAYIGHAAHLGGFVCGCLLGAIFKGLQRNGYLLHPRDDQRRNNAAAGHRLGGARHGENVHDPEVAAQRERWRQEFRYGD
ncbi:transmembrane protein, putative [Bodo saltans]|uniref:Transmembrane protein, putative n=1 Tax=Bodo saltans TaxID=75058 RepID=A0A0S4JRY2_BODSA|nr:transmembrane protein, putative [Bodo saltans]|eukprot:CUG92723.1 transmembrane protein, putative [Bodo saltans]